MKLSLFVAFALLGCVAAVSLNKGVLQPRFAEVRNHPAASQNYKNGDDAEAGYAHGLDPTKTKVSHTDTKYTPGASCVDFKDCKTCGTAGHKGVSENFICSWVPKHPHGDERDDATTVTQGKQFIGVCVEDENPAAQIGEKLSECDKVHSPEVTDSFNIVDDYNQYDTSGGLEKVGYAVAAHAEQVYTTAQELGAGEGPESEAAGDWLEAGMTRKEYEGYLDGDKLDAANQDNAAKNDAYVGTDNVFVLGSDDSSYQPIAPQATKGPGLDYLNQGTPVDS